MHQAGINVRFMGRVRSHVLRPDLRRIMLLEMLSRLLKTLLNAALRTKMEEVIFLEPMGNCPRRIPNTT